MDDETIVARVSDLPDRVLLVAALALCDEVLERISHSEHGKESARLVIRTLLDADGLTAKEGE